MLCKGMKLMLFGIKAKEMPDLGRKSDDSRQEKVSKGIRRLIPIGNLLIENRTALFTRAADGFHRGKYIQCNLGGG